MEKFKNLILIGTSHVAQQSLKEVAEAIINEQPKIVALELDKKRFAGLMSRIKEHVSIKDIKRLGIKVFLLNYIGAWIENKIGSLTGVKPGSEMKLSANLAKEIGAKIALIDRDISITLKLLLKKITRQEKIQLLKDIFQGLISKNRKKELANFDLRKIPEKELINKLVKEIKTKYPTLYKVLISDRNLYMAKNLYKLMNTYEQDKIVAVVGAGHSDGILKLIKKWSEKRNNLKKETI